MADPIRDRITITHEEVREHLRDDALSDDAIDRWLDAASDRIEEYIGHRFTTVNANGIEIEQPIPAPVEAAVMRIVASLYEWRDDETRNARLGDEGAQRSFSSVGAEVYLWPYRRVVGF